MSVFAAIDLGSTSFHLLVARVEDGQIQPLEKISHKVRLAEGICSQNLLCETATRRGLSAIREFSEALDEWQPEATRAVGTQALRQAVNRHEFTEPAEDMLGIPIDVIHGEQEAELIWSAIRSSADIENEHLLTLDIGGGSTEIGFGNGKLDSCASLSLGCVTFTENFFVDGYLTEALYQQAFNTALEKIKQQVDFLDASWDKAMGSSGTIKAACNYAAKLGLESQDEDPRVATRESLASMKEKMMIAGHVDKLELPGVSADRVPLLPGGLAILDALFEALGINQLGLSKSAMREAVIQQLDQQVRGQAGAA